MFQFAVNVGREKSVSMLMFADDCFEPYDKAHSRRRTSLAITSVLMFVVTRQRLLAGVKILPFCSKKRSQFIQQQCLRYRFFGEYVGDLDENSAITGHFSPVKFCNV